MMSVRHRSLGDLVEALSGFPFDSSLFSDLGELPLARIRDVVRGRSSTYYKGAYDPKYLIHDGDMLVGMDGEFNCALWNGGPALLNQRVCRIRVTSHELDSSYLLYYLPVVLKSYEAATPFVTVKHLSMRTLLDAPIPLPTIEQQREVARMLGGADLLRAKCDSAIAQVAGLTQAIFRDCFGDPSVNSNGWRVLTVGEVAAVQGGLQVSAARKGHPREVPYLRVANVFRGFLDMREIKTLRATDTEVARTTLQKDDLLIVEGHGNPSEIGRCALWDGSVAGCVHQNHVIRVRFDPKKVIPRFGCEYLNSPGGRRHLLRSGKTTTGLNTISVSEVRAAPITLPPVPLQQEFACSVDAVEKVRASYEAIAVEMGELFASLQHRAFRGEL